QEVAVDVLKEQRPVVFAPVALARLAHGTGRWIGPECPVIRLAVVIAREAEAGGEDEDQHGRRERKPRWPPAWAIGMNPGVAALRVEDQRRMKGRDVRSDG